MLVLWATYGLLIPSHCITELPSNLLPQLLRLMLFAPANVVGATPPVPCPYWYCQSVRLITFSVVKLLLISMPSPLRFDPFFVVTKITPLEALAPYRAAALPPFNTETDFYFVRV